MQKDSFMSEKSHAVAEITAFGGVDSTAPASENLACDSVNFRILPDGSLYKRSGYRKILQIDGNIRTMWSGSINDEFTGFLLVGSKVYQMDFDENTLTLVGSVDTSSGKATFIYYMNSMFLLDGSKLYHIGSEGIRRAQGYAPLIGKDWPTTYVGDENEPINLVTRRVRISYLAGSLPTVYLRTKYNVASVDAFYLNGVLLDSTAYTYDDSTKTIYYDNIKENDRVIVYLTLAEGAFDDSGFNTCTSASVFGGIYNSRAFMWGGNDSSVMYCSREVSREDIAESSKIYAEDAGLYIPSGYEFKVGDGRYGITAVNRHYDRLLIFTKGDAWMADSSACGTEQHPVMTINSSYGCASYGATAKCGNDPVTVGDGTIYRWTSDTDELNDCNAYSLSGQIDSLLDDAFYTSAVVWCDRRSDELLFSYPDSPDGTVWVYGMKAGKWYRYTGIGAEAFFDANGKCGFIRENGLYVFDTACMYDYDSDQTQKTISAVYESNHMGFGRQSEAKRLSKVSAYMQGSGTVSLGFSENGKNLAGLTFDSDNLTDDGIRRCYVKRLNSARFHSCSVRISNSDGGRPRIFGICTAVKK